MAINPQIRVRLPSEVIKIWDAAAKRAGMEFSEYLSDRILLLTEPEPSSGVHVAKAVLTAWRALEALHGRAITLESDLAPRTILTLIHLLQGAIPELRQKRPEEKDMRILRIISALNKASVSDIGQALRMELAIEDFDDPPAKAQPSEPQQNPLRQDKKVEPSEPNNLLMPGSNALRASA